MATKSLFDSFFAYVKDTEPPLIYYRWSLISAVGAFLGRNCYINMGRFRVFPNHYIMLIGNPGTRKNTATYAIKKLLQDAGYANFSASKTRKEKFLLDLEGIGEDEKKKAGTDKVFENLFGEGGLEDTSGADPREVFIVAPEFNNFLPPGDLEFLSDLGDLWDWDDERGFYKYRLKNSKSVKIFQPTVSLLGGNTHAGFQQMFPPQSLGQGIMSRIILVYSEPSGKKFTFPSDPDPKLEKEIVDTLRAMREQCRGSLVITADARRALDLVYRSWQEIADQRFKHYSTRRFTHLLKLCIVCAACRVSKVVTLDDALLANSLLTYTESFMPKALGEFGKSKNAEAANKIMNALYDTKRPLKLPELWKVVSNDLDKVNDLSNLLVNLQNADKIQIVKGEGFLPKQRALNNKMVYVDYSLLKEFDETHG